MGNYKATVTQEIDITPKDLARIFCDFHDEQQAEFFSEIGEIIKSWEFGSYSFEMQMCDVADNNLLSEEGLNVMATIGSMAEK